MNKFNGGFYQKLSKSVDTSIRLDVYDGIWRNKDFLQHSSRNWSSDYLKGLHKRQIMCWK